jgi:hypothetical protein
MTPDLSYVKERDGPIASAVRFSCLDRADCKDVPPAIQAVERAWTGGWTRAARFTTSMRPQHYGRQANGNHIAIQNEGVAALVSRVVSKFCLKTRSWTLNQTIKMNEKETTSAFPNSR